MKAMSVHAVKRAARRNLSQEDIGYVLRNGSKLYRAGACFYYLCGKDIPVKDRGEDTFARVEGTIVVLDAKQKMVVSVYRNREKGLKTIRSKQDYMAFGV